MSHSTLTPNLPACPIFSCLPAFLPFLLTRSKPYINGQPPQTCTFPAWIATSSFPETSLFCVIFTFSHLVFVPQGFCSSRSIFLLEPRFLWGSLPCHLYWLSSVTYLFISSIWSAYPLTTHGAMVYWEKCLFYRRRNHRCRPTRRPWTRAPSWALSRATTTTTRRSASPSLTRKRTTCAGATRSMPLSKRARHARWLFA